MTYGCVTYAVTINRNDRRQAQYISDNRENDNNVVCIYGCEKKM